MTLNDQLDDIRAQAPEVYVDLINKTNNLEVLKLDIQRKSCLVLLREIDNCISSGVAYQEIDGEVMMLNCADVMGILWGIEKELTDA